MEHINEQALELFRFGNEKSQTVIAAKCGDSTKKHFDAYLTLKDDVGFFYLPFPHVHATVWSHSMLTPL